MQQPSKSKFADMARKLGAELSPKPISEFFRRMVYRLRSRFNRRPTIVMVDRPRDLDDPLNDPELQSRVGEAIAKRAIRRDRKG
jgi:hypothetical protein